MLVKTLHQAANEIQTWLDWLQLIEVEWLMSDILGYFGWIGTQESS